MTGADNSTPLIPLAAFRGIIRRGAEGGLLTTYRRPQEKTCAVVCAAGSALPLEAVWQKAKGAERTQPRNCTDRNHII